MHLSPKTDYAAVDAVVLSGSAAVDPIVLQTHIRTSKITEPYWLMDFLSDTLGIELRNHSFS